MKQFFPYSKQIIRHFKEPRNMGKIKNPDAIGEAGNLVCGDVMRLYLKIEEKRGKKIIKDIKFETFGCIVAIANSSMLTTMVKGKTLEEVMKIKKEDLIKKLGKPLPPFKIHCSILAIDALHEALYNYYLKKKLPIPEELKKEHERIKKTLSEIEGKHKEFVEMERKLLEKG
ncbi:MAG: iron-sulfur cluster assembly scaffold protein [Candidatus Aenigmatarchaeota archaeon]